MIREWRATLLANGVSVSVTAKAYRLLRAVLMTAVEDDKILPRNPCRIRGAGTEDAGERPVLDGGPGLRAGRAGRASTGRQHPQDPGRLPAPLLPPWRDAHVTRGVRLTRADAERALWTMASDGRADCTYDRRFYALVLLATFASLRWGEATALRRCDLDLNAGTVRIRAAYVERSTGEMLLGPPKSKAGRRIVGVPAAIIPALRDHLAIFAKDEPGALVFPGAKGGPLRRGNFNKMSAWPQAVASIGMTGLHFHDLRHTGNQFAAQSGAGLRDLMARMGHDSERAAMIYQHEAHGADKTITNAIDTHVQAEQAKRDDDEDGSAGVLVPAG